MTRAEQIVTMVALSVMWFAAGVLVIVVSSGV